VRRRPNFLLHSAAYDPAPASPPRETEKMLAYRLSLLQHTNDRFGEIYARRCGMPLADADAELAAEISLTSWAALARGVVSRIYY
jgi:hypothetical protein